MVIITIVTSLKKYKQQQMKSESVRKTSILHDNVFGVLLGHPHAAQIFYLIVTGLTKVDYLGLLGFQ